MPFSFFGVNFTSSVRPIYKQRAHLIFICLRKSISPSLWGGCEYVWYRYAGWCAFSVCILLFGFEMVVATLIFIYLKVSIVSQIDSDRPWEVSEHACEG